MSRHVSAEILALNRESAVSAVEAARIAAHLAGCPKCADIEAALTSVTSVLAATEVPPMPEAFTVRIHTAIRRESVARAASATASATPAPADGARATRSAGPAADGTSGADSIDGYGTGLGAAGAADGPGEPGSPHIPGRPDLPERRSSSSRRFRMPGWSSPLLLRGLAAAAAVVVIAGGGILLANARSASQNSGAGGAGTGAPGGARPSVVHSNGRQASFGAEGPVTVSYRMKGKIATTTAVVSHRNFTAESLPGMVRKQVASLTSVGPGPVGPTSVAGPGSVGTAAPHSRIGGVSISALEGCLTAMAAGRQVLVADVARFLGRPATIIVMRSPTIANDLYVGIVGLSCSASALHVVQTLTVPVR